MIRIFFSTFALVAICIFSNSKANAQGQKQMVRLAKLEIDSTQLDSYKIFLKEEIEASIKLEKGVLTLYAVFEIKKPNHLTILEIYEDKKVYEKHIQTPHFKKYKEGTKDMVKAIELIETIPLIPNMKIK
jgi:4-carboxymuconolactone decarboxylase